MNGEKLDWEPYVPYRVSGGKCQEIYGQALGLDTLDPIEDDTDLRAQLRSRGWEALTGYSGQYGYSGPVMHDSEYLGGTLSDAILSEDGIYAWAPVEWWPDDDAGKTEPEYEGWVVCRRG